MLLMTQPQFCSSTWKAAFPDLDISTTSSLPANWQEHQMIWVVSQIPNWQEHIKTAVEKGKKVIVLSRQTSNVEFKEAFKLGARGYLNALTHPETLKTVCNSVENGALWIPEKQVNQMINYSSSAISSSATPNTEALTCTEKKVADKVATGESNKEVGEDLNISERTVKSHLTSIYNKLNLRDRMHLMLYMQGKI